MEHEDDYPLEMDGDGASPLNEMVMDFTDLFTNHTLFETRDDLLNWVRKIGNENGMVIVVNRSDVGNKKYKGRLCLGCERGEEYRDRMPKMAIVLANDEVDEFDINLKKDKDGRKRDTGTKKCGCPFLLKAKQLELMGDWVLEVVCAIHNHPTATYLEGHAFAGRLTIPEEDYVVELSLSNVKPKTILRKLKKNFKGNVSKLKTIYNARTKHKINERGGQSQMQYLKGKLLDHDYYFLDRRCGEVVTDLFFAHHKSIDLLRAFPSVVLMDCTYKTNRFRFPLLEIVGVTSTDMTFCIACAFMKSEKEDNYTWALSTLKLLLDNSCYPSVIITDRELALINAVQCIFPGTTHFLCRWHISKNILANCKKYFKKKHWKSFQASWNMLVASNDVQTFEVSLRNFRDSFSEWPTAVTYVIQNWIEPYKEKFVSCWTNNIMHYENVTTSRFGFDCERCLLCLNFVNTYLTWHSYFYEFYRAEGHHAALKRQLRTSMGTFENCWNEIHTLLESSHTEIKNSLEKSVNVVQHKYSPIHFKILRGVVSETALNRILEELKIVSADVPVDPAYCGCILRKTCGLPCAHELSMFVLSRKPIPLECVDKFWRKLDIEVTPREKCSVDEDEAILAQWRECMDGLEKMFVSASISEKHLMLRQIREVKNPITTPLLEPQPITSTRGRPKAGLSKSLKSTKRDPSAFEYEENMCIGTCSPMPSQTNIYETGSTTCKPIFSTNKRQKIPKQTRFKKPRVQSETLESRDFVASLPLEWAPWVSTMKNVDDDGHCGFRAIAHMMGFDESSWGRVRKDLHRELTSNVEMYAGVFLMDGRVDMVIEKLECFDSVAPKDKWFVLPDMGYLVASAYNVVLMALTPKQSLTFLPLRTSPPEQTKKICMALVNDNHFIAVNLQNGHPHPPVAVQWHKFRHPIADPWITFSQEYMSSTKSWSRKIHRFVGQ